VASSAAKNSTAAERALWRIAQFVSGFAVMVERALSEAFDLVSMEMQLYCDRLRKKPLSILAPIDCSGASLSSVWRQQCEP
jgi:hypothetical protein